MQFGRRRFKEPADVAGRLTDPLLVLDQRDAHEALAVLAEAHARGHRDLRLLELLPAVHLDPGLQHLAVERLEERRQLGLGRQRFLVLLDDPLQRRHAGAQLVVLGELLLELGVLHLQAAVLVLRGLDVGDESLVEELPVESADQEAGDGEDHHLLPRGQACEVSCGRHQ